MAIYDFLTKDKTYNEFLQRYSDIEAKIKRSEQQRIDSRVAGYFAKREAQQLEQDYVEYLKAKLIDIKEQKRQARLKHERPIYDDPQQETLRRQDMEAKLNTMDENSIKELISDTQAEDITVYDFNLMLSKVSDHHGITQKVAQLKHDLSVENTDEYKQMDEQETAFYQLHGGLDGQQLRNKLYTFKDGEMAGIVDIQQSLTALADRHRTTSPGITETSRFMQHHGITDEHVQGVR